MLAIVKQVSGQQKIIPKTFFDICFHSGCVFITYEIVNLNQAITIDTRAILQEKQKSFIYLTPITKAEQETLSTSTFLCSVKMFYDNLAYVSRCTIRIAISRASFYCTTLTCHNVLILQVWLIKSERSSIKLLRNLLQYHLKSSIVPWIVRTWNSTV